MKTPTPPTNPPTPPPGDPRPPWTWREVGVVLLLMAMVGGLRAWQIGQTAVASRDSIAFIHYAWLLDHQAWPEVIRSAPRHPGYPVAVWALAKGLSWVSHGPAPVLMQASAQWVSGLAGVLLVIPLYGLGRAWFGRAAGVGAVLLFQGLPTGSLILSDGLSEGLFLLLAASAAWAVTIGLRRHSPWALGVGGLFSGLAYLVRPEGALIVAAAAVVLLAQQISKTQRQPWGRMVRGGVGLVGAGLIVALPLVLTTGKLTPKTTANIILQDGAVSSERPTFATPYLPWPHQLRALDKLLASPEPAPAPPTAQPTGPRPAAVPTPPAAKIKPVGLVPGTVELAWELLQGLGYFAWLPVLIGVWAYRRKLGTMEGAWVFFLTSLGILAFLWRVAVTVGYLSERHLLLIILGVTLWAAAGLVAISLGLARLLRHRVHHRWIFLALVAAMVVPFLGRSFQPLHADRAGYRLAGLWLAEHNPDDDVVVDPHCWAAFYAGKAFRLDDGFTPRPGSRKVFVVLDGVEASQSHLQTMPLARQLASRGEIVFRTGTSKGKGKGEVVVYQVPLPRP